MPTSPPRPCSKHRSVLVKFGGKCPHCINRTRQVERERSVQRRRDPNNSIHFYTAPRWRKLRAWFIAANPLCAECQRQGRVTAAAHIDHIMPMEDGGAPYDTDNMQPLCKACHSAKTMRETRGRGSNSHKLGR